MGFTATVCVHAALLLTSPPTVNEIIIGTFCILLYLIASVCAALPLAELVVIDGADHSFKAGKKDTIQVLVSATHNWITKILQQ